MIEYNVSCNKNLRTKPNFRDFSEFPWDILEEMSDIDFEQFNNESGSHITLVPCVVHYFLFNQVILCIVNWTIYIIQIAYIETINKLSYLE